jgi:mercuric ion transport protein
VKDNALLRTGWIGTAVAALCCFTPVLVILLGAVGFSAIVGWLDYVPLPALAGIIAIARAAARCCGPSRVIAASIAPTAPCRVRRCRTRRTTRKMEPSARVRA